VIHPAGAVDATLPEPDWERVCELRRAGVTDAGMYRLLQLRTWYRRGGGSATDGTDGTDGTDDFERNPRALFARWLVAQGRLNEDA
jgi:hypothetical protein